MTDIKNSVTLFESFSFKGLELRDYFAAHALQALITKMPLGELNRDEYTGVYEDVAFSAYEYANEMIKEREKTNG